jgi:hypothetical protein
MGRRNVFIVETPGGWAAEGGVGTTRIARAGAKIRTEYARARHTRRHAEARPRDVVLALKFRTRVASS